MQKNKFLSLLKKLTKAELEGFHKDLKESHGRETIALRVFEYLIRFYPDFNQKEKLRMEYAYERIFKKGFDMDVGAKKKMQDNASKLNIWLKDYLIVSKALQNPQLQQAIWLSILQDKGLNEEFSKRAAAFYDQTRRAPFLTPSDALPNWMASYFHREHLSWDKPLVQAKVIQQCTDTMADCWEVIRLKMACEMSLVHKTNEQAPTQKEAEAIDYQQVGLSILKDIYAVLLVLTDSGDEEHFVRLESLLQLHGHQIDPKELEGIIQYAYNFTADQSRRNQDAIQYERTHRLNKIGLVHGVFSQKGYFVSAAFANIVTVACLTKDFEWANGFIQDYSHVLPDDNRQEAIFLAQAIIAFETGGFREVLQLLEHVRFESPLDTLRAKSLLLRSYYELKADPDVILDTCVYLENMLRRSPKTDAVKAMLAFVLILKRLVAQKSSKKSIIESIHKFPKIYSKIWLLGKTASYKPVFSVRNISR